MAWPRITSPTTSPELWWIQAMLSEPKRTGVAVLAMTAVLVVVLAAKSEWTYVVAYCASMLVLGALRWLESVERERQAARDEARSAVAARVDAIEGRLARTESTVSLVAVRPGHGGNRL
jgi:hypothetical protein